MEQAKLTQGNADVQQKLDQAIETKHASLTERHDKCEAALAEKLAEIGLLQADAAKELAHAAESKKMLQELSSQYAELLKAVHSMQEQLKKQQDDEAALKANHDEQLAAEAATKDALQTGIQALDRKITELCPLVERLTQDNHELQKSAQEAQLHTHQQYDVMQQQFRQQQEAMQKQGQAATQYIERQQQVMQQQSQGAQSLSIQLAKCRELVMQPKHYLVEDGAWQSATVSSPTRTGFTVAGIPAGKKVFLRRVEFGRNAGNIQQIDGVKISIGGHNHPLSQLSVLASDKSVHFTAGSIQMTEHVVYDIVIRFRHDLLLSPSRWVSYQLQIGQIGDMKVMPLDNAVEQTIIAAIVFEVVDPILSKL